MSLDRPRFRQDLEAVPFEADGQAYVEVRDPTTGGSFQFYDLEYRVALSFDGLSFDRVIPWLKLATGMEFQEPQLREFALRLDQLGFLESSTTGVLQAEAAVSPEGQAEEPSLEKAGAVESSQAATLDRLEDKELAPSEEVQEFAVLPTEVSRDAPSSLSQALEEAVLVPDQSGSEADPALPVGVEAGEGEAPEPGAGSDVAPEPVPAYEQASAAPNEAGLVEAVVGSVGETEGAAEAGEVADAEEANDVGVGEEAPADEGEGEAANAVAGAVGEGGATGDNALLIGAPVYVPAQTAMEPEAGAEVEPASVPETVASEPESFHEVATVASEPGPSPEPATEAVEAEPGDVVAAGEEAAPVSVEPGTVTFGLSKDAEARMAAARQLDSSAFPVLPTPPPQSFAFTPPPVTPPVRAISQAFVTPRPTTLGPLLLAQQTALRRQQRRSLLLFGSLGVLAAVAVLLIVVPFFFPTREPARADVRVLAAAPGTIFRYFPGAGGVSVLPGPVLKFPAAGKVARIVKAGSAVAVGDVLAAVESARPLLNQLAQQRERLAFHQQMVEGMRQVGNADEEERQAANLEVRKARIAKTLRSLAQVAVVATVVGEVEEAFTREGDTVETGSLALRLRSAGHRATFEMPRSLAAEARRLGLCQVGVDSLVLDCMQSQERGDETHVTVDIPSLPPVLMGRPARLARARFDAAVALPTSAVLGVGRRHHVLLVSPLGRVEVRPVTLAEQNLAEAIVIQGLDPGDNVILEPSLELRPGMHVAIKS